MRQNLGWPGNITLERGGKMVYHKKPSKARPEVGVGDFRMLGKMRSYGSWTRWRRGRGHSSLEVLPLDESTALTGRSHPRTGPGSSAMGTPQSSERGEIESCTQVSSFQTLKRRIADWLTGSSAVYSPQNSDSGEFCGPYTAELRQR